MTELETIRTRLGFSQVQMGERLGMHRNSIANAERKDDDDKTTLLAARMVALTEACMRADLGVLSKNDRAMVVRLAGLLIGGEMSASSEFVQIHAIDVDAEHRLAGPVKPKLNTRSAAVHPSLKSK